MVFLSNRHNQREKARSQKASKTKQKNERERVERKETSRKRELERTTRKLENERAARKETTNGERAVITCNKKRVEGEKKINI